jgi:hypothetical protein
MFFFLQVVLGRHMINVQGAWAVGPPVGTKFNDEEGGSAELHSETEEDRHLWEKLQQILVLLM